MSQPQQESYTVIRDRAVSVADYLLAVRAHMERPARTVPADAYRLDTLPAHPAVELGPAPDGTSWLRVGLPDLPGPVAVPAELRRRLNEISATDEPKAADAADAPADASFETWRDQVWRPWALLSQEAEKARTLHRQLFDLMHQVDMTAATTELVWGHGILETAVGDQRVRYPLVATPVIIEYEPDRSLITVSPQGPSRLQTDALAGLDERYLGQLLALAGPAGTLEVDLWNDLERRELFERALGRLGFERRVVEPGQSATGPHLVDTGVLFARPRQRLLRGFLESLRDRLLAGDTGSIGALAAIVAHEPSRLRMPDDRPEDWHRVGERLLMPLPTNAAQESIARRLALHRNVAVQGPPGTGKTHTIRNLICHLMANGKRVLVVAQKEDPLRVLRDGLPEEVRALCLAVLGRTTDQLVQLQLAARELSDRAATLDKTAEAARVERLTGRLEDAERGLAAALGGLRAIAENEAATYRIDGVGLSPADVGAWLRERAAADGGIPDAVAPSDSPPLSADEFAALLDLAARLAPADRAAALRPLPDVAALPDAATARAARADREAAADRVSRLEMAGVDTDSVRAQGPSLVSELLEGLRDAVAWLHRREGTWTDRLGRLLSDPHWATMWTDHVRATEELQRSLAELARVLGGHRVTAANALVAEPKRLLAGLGELRERFAAGKGVNRLLQAGLWRIADEVRVDGESLRTVEDADLAAAWVRRGQAQRRLGEHWAEWIQRLGIPERHGDPEVWAGTLLAEAAQSLGWDARQWPELSARLRVLVPQEELDLDAARLAEVSALLDDSPVVFELDELDARDRAVADGLVPWPALAAAWFDPALEQWDDLVAEARRLVALRPEAARYVELRDRLAEVAPEWAGQVGAGLVPAVSGAACLRAWQWRQAQTWFDLVVGSVDPAVLNRRVELGRDKIRRLTGELVVASAWLEVARALDDRRRAALADWTTALRKIGKGTGRTAAAWQAHAQRAMESAVEAVPVWVMSVDRAIEQFAGGAHFDVVIVDEASQADLFALPVLSLAERAVVVGDDQQIGPQLGFVGSVTGLIHSHLGDVPSAEHFDPESSLYDHAVRRSPERILLTEHFRCVPQIIEFSSRHYYDGKIQPLRADRPLSAPVRPVFIPDGVRQPLAPYGDVNVAEADALVAQVAALVADPAYRGRTIGVISLLSTSGQANYLLGALREAIGEDEMEARRLRVGDAYTFQGDERDVVLVSMVVSDNDGRPAAFTKREYHRRVNVAASRARDQLWIFHSVRASSLLADDARALLLNYALNLPVQTTAPDLEVLCESDFEREVLRRLVKRGYRPTPQFRIGGYRIDFVLNAPDGRRLAIECDGDAYHGPEQWEGDMRRQAVLERVGNCVFVRIRGSIFAREPEAALRPLWQRIEELDVAPWRADEPLVSEDRTDGDTPSDSDPSPGAAAAAG
ncbi:AAA domain-containing protein [Actinoplanes sp. NPDC049118]|uniref:AAA domain-containing protein n=1 Tax=Actinoplanes sp. NPDC049118 TaxID=3155769 RepID=UPI00340DB51C